MQVSFKKMALDPEEMVRWLGVYNYDVGKVVLKKGKLDQIDFLIFILPITSISNILFQLNFEKKR